eukprot:3976455-Pleurochrysis_carterae.AAC.3
MPVGGGVVANTFGERKVPSLSRERAPLLAARLNPKGPHVRGRFFPPAHVAIVLGRNPPISATHALRPHTQLMSPHESPHAAGPLIIRPGSTLCNWFRLAPTVQCTSQHCAGMRTRERTLKSGARTQSAPLPLQASRRAFSSAASGDTSQPVTFVHVSNSFLLVLGPTTKGSWWLGATRARSTPQHAYQHAH